MAHQESGRQHLSPDILRIVDNRGITYQEMQPGQNLRIYAEDAVTRQQASFNVTVISVRDTDERRATKTATLRFRDGDFNFYDGENINQPLQLQPGTLMENGISGIMVPQTDYRLVYFGGIGLGRDHSFEFIGGEDKSVIAHKVNMIDIGNAPVDFQAPDLSDYFRSIEAVRQKQRQDENKRIEEVNRVVMADLEERFSKHPDYDSIRDLIAAYSPNGKLVMSSFLIYAQEDDVLDDAWEALKQAHQEHFQYEHPRIRGDLDIKASSRKVFEDMMRTAGIKWPRPEQIAE